MKEEKINNETIKVYIDKLVALYGVYPLVNETALRIQFDHKLYAECVLEIMRKMGLKNTVKVICYADYRYPCKLSAARINLPRPMPALGSQRFNALRIQVEMKESIKRHFYAFVSSIAHELSHIVMHGTDHELRESEIATDLCILVFGFSDFVIKGKNITQWTVLGHQRVILGYLSQEQLDYAVDYINQLRNDYPKTKKQNVKETIVDRLINFIKRLF